MNIDRLKEVIKRERQSNAAGGNDPRNQRLPLLLLLPKTMRTDFHHKVNKIELDILELMIAEKEKK